MRRLICIDWYNIEDGESCILQGNHDIFTLKRALLDQIAIFGLKQLIINDLVPHLRLKVETNLNVLVVHDSYLRLVCIGEPVRADISAS